MTPLKIDPRQKSVRALAHGLLRWPFSKTAPRRRCTSPPGIWTPKSPRVWDFHTSAIPVSYTVLPFLTWSTDVGPKARQPTLERSGFVTLVAETRQSTPEIK